MWVWIRLLRFAFTFLLFFFFFFSFLPLLLRTRLGDKQLLFMNSSHILLTFQPLLSVSWVPWIVHGTHKLHFSEIFSLKIGPTVLFTHLKIILLQYFQFSVFSFSKISSIQTDPNIHKTLVSFSLSTLIVILSQYISSLSHQC